MNMSDSITEFAPAYLAAQKNIGAAIKDQENPFLKNKYADLAAVIDACKEALNEQGIGVLQPVSTDGEATYVMTILLHTSGQYISDRMRVIVEKANNAQALGSAITYARRYSLQSMVFIPAEDDDGNKATQSSQESQSTVRSSNTGSTQPRSTSSSRINATVAAVPPSSPSHPASTTQTTKKDQPPQEPPLDISDVPADIKECKTALQRLVKGFGPYQIEALIQYRTTRGIPTDKKNWTVLESQNAVAATRVWIEHFQYPWEQGAQTEPQKVEIKKYLLTAGDATIARLCIRLFGKGKAVGTLTAGEMDTLISMFRAYDYSILLANQVDVDEEGVVFASVSVYDENASHPLDLIEAGTTEKIDAYFASLRRLIRDGAVLPESMTTGAQKKAYDTFMAAA